MDKDKKTRNGLMLITLPIIPSGRGSFDWDNVSSIECINNRVYITNLTNYLALELVQNQPSPIDQSLKITANIFCCQPKFNRYYDCLPMTYFLQLGGSHCSRFSGEKRQELIFFTTVYLSY